MKKNNKLSIYLLKEGINDENQILKSPVGKIAIPGAGNFFYEQSNIRSPAWINNFFGTSIGNVGILSASSKGILITSIIYHLKEIVFAIPFGTGRHLLADDIIEERFGLKVTLNSIVPESIRSIEKRTLGANPKIAKEQMGKATKASEFGIDIEQDLIKMITGTSKFPNISKIISGSDVLSVSATVDFSTINNYLQKCYERYLSKDYQKDFDWIDQIQEIKDSSKVKHLDELILQKINNRELDQIWMAVPELIDWDDLRGFKYNTRQAEFSSDIDIIEFIDSFDASIDDIQKLKTKKIMACSASTEDIIETWAAYKCLYGELEDNGKQFMINNGKWYEINNDFVTRVNNDYNSIQLCTTIFPDYKHTSEQEYTIDICSKTPNFLCMDRKNISYGGGKSKIEFCDVYSQSGQMIHIKPYGASSVLSHLFQQGLVSGELFVSDAEFRKALNKKLTAGWKLSSSSKKVNASAYEIVYAIISNKPDIRPNIPFFSKVSIKNAKRRLQSFGYKVTIAKITSLK